MNIKLKKRGLTKTLVILLLSTLMISSAFSGIFSSGIEKALTASKQESAIVQRDAVNNASQVDDELVEKEELIGDEDYVNYIVQVDKTTTITNLYEMVADKNTTYNEYLRSRGARNNAENIDKTHSAFFKQIKKQVDAEFLTSYSTLVNAFAVKIKYKDRIKLENVATDIGAASVYFSNRYEEPLYEKVENVVDVWDTGIFKRPQDMKNDELIYDYQGEGMFIAVLDTGLDYEHPAFSDENLPEDESVLVTKADIEAILPFLSPVRGSLDKDKETVRRLEGATIDDFYTSKKVPFSFDYADFDTETNTTEEKMHGTHVSGIVAGRSENPVDGSGNPVLDAKGRTVVGIEGVAPKAQIAALKVFGDQSGTEEVYMLAALEDCAYLGVDVINMSLGSPSGLTTAETSIMADAYEAIGEIGISIIVAAGNSHSIGARSHFGLNDPSNPDSGILSAPASYSETFAVASIQGIKAPFFRALSMTSAELGIAYFTEASNPADAEFGDRSFVDSLYNAIVGSSEFSSYFIPDSVDSNKGIIKVPYVMVPGVGETSDYSGLSGANSVRGKVAVIKRGKNTFVQKLKNATSAQAIGAIVYNNASGIFAMQIDDSIAIPACSITSTAAASFVTTKTGYIEFGVERVIDGNTSKMQNTDEYKAGPFMSDFSSWGAMSDLTLKPEITGHGGQIYSASPGGSYDRISGTSMAAPNIAGLVTIARQRIMDEPEKYGVLKDANTPSKATDGVVDFNKVEERVYQIMMSTATVPDNEESNPYSPRLIGAGLANITNFMRTDAFIYIPDAAGLDGMKSRTKLELKDDASDPAKGQDQTKWGVYEAEFVIRNMSSDPQKYLFNSVTMTEDVSLNGKTVTEKAFMLDNFTDKKWWVDGNPVSLDSEIIVAGNTDVTVKLKFTLLDGAKTHLKKFINGMYVEGFIQLTALNEDGTISNTIPHLGVPYLAFYGDWLKAPLFDYTVYEVSADAKDDSIYDDNKRYPQMTPLQIMAKYIENGTPYSLPVGSPVFAVPESMKNVLPAATAERTTLSLNIHAANEIYYVAGFLRASPVTEWEIRNKATGQLMDQGVTYAKKGYGAMIEKKPQDIGCQVNATYTITIRAKLDYPGATVQTRTLEFTVDGDAPIVTNANLRVERNSQNIYLRYLELFIHDDHFLQVVDINIYDKERDDYISLLPDLVSNYDTGLYPVNSDKNATTKVMFQLTSIWERIEQNDYKIYIRVYDMSFNQSYYEINIQNMLAPAVTKLAFGDIGIYGTYEKRDNSGSKTILTGYNEKIATDENGVRKTMSSITVRQNQAIKLDFALMAEPANVWVEKLVWSSNAPSIVSIDSETGEMFARAPGSATITVRSGTVSATLVVEVLSKEEIETYAGLSALNANVAGLKGADIKQGNKELRAGESFEVEVDPLPWFTDKSKLELTWSSSDNKVATVQPIPGTFKAIVTAQKGTWYYMKDGVKTPIALHDDGEFYEIDSNGEFILDDTNLIHVDKADVLYAENNNGISLIRVVIRHVDTLSIASDTIVVSVGKEFRVNGGTLEEYNGYSENVYIPTNIDIKIIGRRAFATLNFIERVEISEGIERIEGSAFYFMKGLREVKLPSTIKFIGHFAFAAHYNVADGVTTSLNVFDTTSLVHPIQLGTDVFRNQMALGTDVSVIKGSFQWLGSDFSIIKFYGTEYTKFDTKMIRSVGKLAFYNCIALTELDLTGLRYMAEAAFAYIGSRAAYLSATDDRVTPRYLEVEFGPLTSLGMESFYQSGAKDLELPMRRIVYHSFFNNRYLENIVFTADNLVVEREAFSVCFIQLIKVSTDETLPKEGTITFKGTVEYIGDKAFSHDTILPLELETIDFQKNVKHIGSEAFRGSNIQSQLTLPNGLKYLGKDAFANVPTLEKVIIPKDLKDPVDFGAAFYYTPNFKFIEVDPLNPRYEVAQVASGGGETMDVLVYLNDQSEKEMTLIPNGREFTGKFTVPSMVTVLGQSAFSFNMNLTQIDLGNVTRVAPYALAYMPFLEEVTFSVGITEIPEGMFFGSGCPITIPSLDVDEDDLVIGDDSIELVLIGYENVLKIGKKAFENSAITTYDFTQITSIGEYAFSRSKIQSFIAPVGVTQIADYAFYGAADLSVATFHDGVTKIGEYAFAGIPADKISNKLTTVRGDYIAVVGEGAFAYCNFLETVNLTGVTDIGEFAFIAESGKGKITDVKIPGVRFIGTSAFENQGLSWKAYIPVVREVGAYAFANTGITELTVGSSSTTKIGQGAFLNCKSLTSSFEVPKNLTHMGPLAFSGSGVSNFTVAAGNIAGYSAKDGVLFRTYETGLYELVVYPSGTNRENSYDVPEGVGRVAEYSFAGVKSLTFITLPSTLKYIGNKAFFDSSISTYRFMSYNAPILEAENSNLKTSDINAYSWAVYANFYGYFSPSEIEERVVNGKTTYVFTSTFRYNTITSNFTSDTWKSTNGKSAANFSITGAGDNRNASRYGLVMIRPANGMGYNDFVYSNYFDSIIMDIEIVEARTQKVIDLVKALPSVSVITGYAAAIQYKPLVEEIRLEYNRLTLGQQTLIQNFSLFIAFENKVNQEIDNTVTYSVYFVIDGALKSSQTVVSGKNATEPANPTKAGYKFSGWFVVSTNNAFSFDSVITSNVVLEARFTSTKTVTVTFSGEGVNLNPETVVVGTTVAKPADPSRSGYKFEGWYIGDNQYNFASEVTEDITLTARWTETDSCAGCGTISLFGGGIGWGILTFVVLLAFFGVLLLRKRNIKTEAHR